MTEVVENAKFIPYCELKHLETAGKIIKRYQEERNITFRPPPGKKN